MQREIAKFVVKCLTSQEVKPQCQKAGELLCSLSSPEWKWEHITMNFLFGLSKTPSGFDGIWIIVDCFTKTS